VTWHPDGLGPEDDTQADVQTELYGVWDDDAPPAVPAWVDDEPTPRADLLTAEIRPWWSYEGPTTPRPARIRPPPAPEPAPWDTPWAENDVKIAFLACMVVLLSGSTLFLGFALAVSWLQGV
jgi:hypothetical protein